MTADNSNEQQIIRTQLARERNKLAEQRTDYSLERTRLANQRTFLAWCRTALALMTFGFVLERIDLFVADLGVSQKMLKELSTLGIVTFIAGPLMLIFAAWRFFALQRRIGLSRADLFFMPEVAVFIFIIGIVLVHVFS